MEMRYATHEGHARRAALAAWLALAACNQEPKLVASNCEREDGCVRQEQPLERIEEVDILIVIDTSGSIEEELEAIRAQLPRMLNAIVSGADGEASFPPASSVHVAVATSDMGLSGVYIDKCEGLGDDGIFVEAQEGELACAAEYDGYLPYETGASAMATTATVSCIPLTGTEGCGFEQPLEAALKALWPASDPQITFFEGEGHGEGANAGFLRPGSLLVVVIVTDEDDCSPMNPSLFAPLEELAADDPLAQQGLNLRCSQNPERLHAPERYVAGFKGLRTDNDNVIFAVIAGIPPELTSEETRAEYDFASEEGVAAYYEAVLQHESMQQTVDPASLGISVHGGNLLPSCVTDSANAQPPRRLVEVARGFGTNGVLGSLCADDFGPTTGAIIRAIGKRLVEAAEAAGDEAD
jgi:hypothetical protein